MLWKTSTNTNCEALLREIKDLNRWRNIPCSWIRIITIIKLYPKLIYRVNAISIKILAGFLIDINKPLVKFTRKCKGLRIGKTMLKKKNKVGGFFYLILRFVIKYGNQGSDNSIKIDKQTTMKEKSLEINPQIYNQ